MHLNAVQRGYQYVLTGCQYIWMYIQGKGRLEDGLRRFWIKTKAGVYL